MAMAMAMSMSMSMSRMLLPTLALFSLSFLFPLFSHTALSPQPSQIGDFEPPRRACSDDPVQHLYAAVRDRLFGSVQRLHRVRADRVLAGAKLLEEVCLL